MSSRQRALLFGGLVILTVARIAMAATLPLADDEAYYWTWSRHLAWGYPDHPPMIAGVIRLTTAVAGSTPLGVRLGSIVFALGTSALLYALGARLFGPATGLLAAVAFQVVPVFALGAILTSPDGPLGFFWILTLWFVWRALHQKGPLEWIAAGVALGLAVISKLPALILWVSIVGVLLSSADGRKWFRRPDLYAMVAAFMITILPAAWWIATHWGLVLLRAHQAQPWVMLGTPALNFLAFFGMQFVYYGPLTFPLLIASLFAILRGNRRHDERFVVLAWGALPLILLTLIGSFSGLPKPHWLAPGYLIALVAAAALGVDADFWRARRRLMLSALASNVLVIAVAFFLAYSVPSPAAVAVRGWDEVATKLTTLIEQTPASPGVFVLTPEYQTASQIAFQLQERVLITTVYQDTAFAARTDSNALTGWNAVFVNNVAAGPVVSIQQLFRRVEALPPIEVRMQGQVVQRLQVYRGYGFRGFATSAQHLNGDAQQWADPKAYGLRRSAAMRMASGTGVELVASATRVHFPYGREIR